MSHFLSANAIFALNDDIIGIAIPRVETKNFAFYVMRVGAALIRLSDSKSVYFQPGDDAASATENADHCFAVAEMVPGENEKLFDQWAAQYF